MRIETYTQIQQVYGTKKVGKAAKPQKSSAAAAASDNFQISAFGKEMQMAKQAVKNSPDVREEVTRPIKDAIKNGTYNVSNEDFANKLLEKLGALS